MICWTADGTTVRALLLRGAANAGRQKTTLRKRPVRNCFMLIILLDYQERDAELLASVAFYLRTGITCFGIKVTSSGVANHRHYRGKKLCCFELRRTEIMLRKFARLSLWMVPIIFVGL